MNLTATNFDIANARACAWASAAAYGRAECGVRNAEWTGCTMRWVHAETTDTHAVVIEGSEFIIIAFRGTASIRNWITDAEFEREILTEEANGDVVKVHKGFLAAFDSIIGQLTDVLKSIGVADRQVSPTGGVGRPASHPIFICGHSLGGALALLAALELQRQKFAVAQIYTFGQPRVGNAAFKRLCEYVIGYKTFRLVYQEDMVPRVPHLPAWHDPYWHVGMEVFVPSDGAPAGAPYLISPSLWRRLISDAWGIYRAFMVSKFAGALDPIVDHHINNYIAALNNAKLPTADCRLPISATAALAPEVNNSGAHRDAATTELPVEPPALRPLPADRQVSPTSQS